MRKYPILVGMPRNYPIHFAEVLVNFFKKNSQIKIAYLAQVFDPASGEPPHLAIGIVMDVQINTITNELRKIVESTCTEDGFIDFIHIDTPEKAELFSSLEPIYVS